MCSYIHNQKQVVHELLYYTCVAIHVHWLTIATALMSACDLISTSTTDEWPCRAAKCNGVALFYSQ